jgi:uncharacterized protein (DUF2252 family)
VRTDATEGDQTREPADAARLSQAERAAAGKAARSRAPLDDHRQFETMPGRDPVGLLLGQAEQRVPELVPIRHGRMLVSPFAFYRGCALPMAEDLSRTPTSRLVVQLCGDAHLANFGVFASPERRLLFDVNDFDETLRGPFEWDLKRLAASIAVIGRDNGYSRQDRSKLVLAAVGSYRTAMREFAKMSTLEVWYARVDVDETLVRFKPELGTRRFKATTAGAAKARTRDSMQALGKLTTTVSGQRRIVSDPPIIVPAEELYTEYAADRLYEEISELIRSYRRTLMPAYQHLLNQFKFVQMARRVVGVGSVGTKAWILLMAADDGQEPLFLQAKEAQKSVLAPYVGRTRHANEGRRVVDGQRLMQASSDIFLGWQRATAGDGVSTDYYIRQLRDWKYSIPIDQMAPADMAMYGRLCAWTLARAHARSGDRIALAAYLGKSDTFDNAIAEFAETYADQTERDYAAFAAAVASGRVQAQHGT